MFLFLHIISFFFYQNEQPAIKADHIVQCLTSREYKNFSKPSNERLVYLGQHALNAFLLESLVPSVVRNKNKNENDEYVDDKKQIRESLLLRLKSSPFILEIINKLNLKQLLRHAATVIYLAKIIISLTLSLIVT